MLVVYSITKGLYPVWSGPPFIVGWKPEWPRAREGKGRDKIKFKWRARTLGKQKENGGKISQAIKNESFHITSQACDVILNVSHVSDIGRTQKTGLGQANWAQTWRRLDGPLNRVISKRRSTICTYMYLRDQFYPGHAREGVPVSDKQGMKSWSG